MKPIGVLGTGSWGTALAVHWAGAGHDVLLWGRRAEFVQELDDARTNSQYLPEIDFPANLRLTSRIADLADVDTVVVAVPSHGFRDALRGYLEVAPARGARTVISSTKGIERETLARMSEVTAQEARDAGREVRFAVLSGPSFALELASNKPTLSVVASEDEALAADLRERLSTPRFRLYSSTDVVGVEIAGSTKNVIAIAAGIVHQLELGHNTLAAVITRGLHEITRLGLACGGRQRTLSGLAGMGDLVLTCTGELSRNRQLGIELVSGRTAEEVDAGSPMVAEGLRSSLAVARIAKEHDVEMPITEEVVNILYHGKRLDRTINDLMTRDLRAETEL